MFKFYKTINFRTNKTNGHEILALLKRSIYGKKEYFPIFFNINLIPLSTNYPSFNEIGWVEIAAKLTVEFSLQKIMLLYFWGLLQQRLSTAKIPWIF